MVGSLNSGILLSCAVLSGCVTSPDAGSVRRFSDGEAASRVVGALCRAAPAGAGSASIDFEFLKTVIVAPLSPDLGIEERNVGKRVRWAGAVERIPEVEPFRARRV